MEIIIIRYKPKCLNGMPTFCNSIAFHSVGNLFDTFFYVFSGVRTQTKARYQVKMGVPTVICVFLMLNVALVKGRTSLLQLRA